MAYLIDSTDNDGLNMLHWAAKKGHADAVELVINQLHLSPNDRVKVCVCVCVCMSVCLVHSLLCEGQRLCYEYVKVQVGHISDCLARHLLMHSLFLASNQLFTYIMCHVIMIAFPHSTLSCYLLLCFLQQSTTKEGAGETPLVLALEGDHLNVAKLLLEKGECASIQLVWHQCGHSI